MVFQDFCSEEENQFSHVFCSPVLTQKHKLKPLQLSLSHTGRALSHLLQMCKASLVPSGSAYAQGQDTCNKSPADRLNATLWWGSFSTRVLALLTLSSFLDGGSQVLRPQGIEPTNTVGLQGGSISLGSNLQATNLMAVKYQAELVTLVLQDEHYKGTIKYLFDPLLKDTAFPNSHCTNMHGISIIIWCQSLKPSMYICAWHIIFPCNPLLYFLAPCLRAGISLVKGSNYKADYFKAASVNSDV